MDDGKKGPAAGGTAAGVGQTTGPANHSATPRKWQRVLRWFFDGGTLNRFDAYRELRDSCLNTTVSQIELRGVKILRKDETVPGAFGPVHCCRYWISPESLQRARDLLGHPRLTGLAAASENALTQAVAVV
jgi:hypothetical protein